MFTRKKWLLYSCLLIIRNKNVIKERTKKFSHEKKGRESEKRKWGKKEKKLSTGLNIITNTKIVRGKKITSNFIINVHSKCVSFHINMISFWRQMIKMHIKIANFYACMPIFWRALYDLLFSCWMPLIKSASLLH